MVKSFDMSSGVWDEADEVMEIVLRPGNHQPSVDPYAGQHLALRLQEVIPAAIPVHVHGRPDVVEETAEQRLH